MEKDKVKIEALVAVPVEKAWQLFTSPEHIVKWNNATPGWHTPKAENDLRNNGRFLYRMEAKDGSMGFDFEGEYEEVLPKKKITYRMSDGRRCEVSFKPIDNTTFIEEVFDPETTNPLEMQRAGWQAILDNFKSYAENLSVHK